MPKYRFYRGFFSAGCAYYGSRPSPRAPLDWTTLRKEDVEEGVHHSFPIFSTYIFCYRDLYIRSTRIWQLKYIYFHGINGQASIDTTGGLSPIETLVNTFSQCCDLYLAHVCFITVGLVLISMAVTPHKSCRTGFLNLFRSGSDQMADEWGCRCMLTPVVDVGVWSPARAARSRRPMIRDQRPSMSPARRQTGWRSEGGLIRQEQLPRTRRSISPRNRSVNNGEKI